MSTEKELSLLRATDAARRAVELLEMKATGAAKQELHKALDYLEKAFKSQ